jgi:hypothetical protein
MDFAVDVKLESMAQGMTHEMLMPSHICREITGEGGGADSIPACHPRRNSSMVKTRSTAASIKKSAAIAKIERSGRLITTDFAIHASRTLRAADWRRNGFEMTDP